MIFLEKETGELFEFLVRSAEPVAREDGVIFKSVFSITSFSLLGILEPDPCSHAEFADKFEFIGMI